MSTLVFSPLTFRLFHAIILTVEQTKPQRKDVKMLPANVHQIVTAPQAAHAWSIAMETAHHRALLAYPQEHKRINTALALIETRGVKITPTHAVVESQSSPGSSYTVNESCGCAWFTYGSQVGERRRCTHRWAYLLYHHAVDRLVNLYAAVYTSMDSAGQLHEESGFAQPFPEDSGFLFFHDATRNHRFLPAPCSNLTLLGKVAWIEGDKLRGALPQAILDLAAPRG